MSEYSENSKNSTSSNDKDNCYCDVCNHDTTWCGCEDNGCCECENARSCDVCNHDTTWCGCEDNGCCSCENKFIDIRSVEGIHFITDWYEDKKQEYFTDNNIKFINLWGEDDEEDTDTNDFLVELIDVVEKGMKTEQPSIFEEIHQSTNIPTDLCNIISQMSVDDIPYDKETKYQDLFIDLVEEHDKYLTGYNITELSKIDLCMFSGETYFVCQNVDIRASHYAFNVENQRYIHEVSYDGKDEYGRETYKNLDNYESEDMWIVQQTKDRFWLVVKIME
jgi:hypothetical protein